MNKLKMAGAIVLAMGVSANVMAGDWFVGGNVGMGFNDLNTPSAIAEPDEQIKYGVQIGKYINDNVRVYGIYNYGSDDDKFAGSKNEITEQQLLISADYLFGDKALKPFIGFTVGADNTEFDVSGQADFSDDDTALVFGGQAGVVYNVDNWDMELGYRHLWGSTEIEKKGYELENDSNGNAYASVSYRF